MDEIVNKIYTRIQKFFHKIEKDNFSINLKGKFEMNNISEIEKLHSIENFIKLNLEEKKKYFSHSKYEIVTLDENIEKLTKNDVFNQENFKNLIDKCKVFMKTERDDRMYIEKLKQEIILLENDKKAIIEKTRQIIEDLKYDNLILIEKIERLIKDQDKINKEKTELFRKTDEIHKKTQENYQLKNEIQKTKTNFSREKNRISITKDKEIDFLWDKLKFVSKYEKELEAEKRDNNKLRGSIHELKMEIQKILTVSIRI